MAMIHNVVQQDVSARINKACQSLSIASIEQLRDMAERLGGITDVASMTKYDLCRALAERYHTGLDPTTIRGRSISEYEDASLSVPRTSIITTSSSISMADIVQRIRHLNQQIDALREQLSSTAQDAATTITPASVAMPVMEQVRA